MKCFFTQWLIICLIFLNVPCTAQTSWQWGKSGGSIADNGSAKIEDVVDMATDTKGNLYILAKVYGIAHVNGQLGIGNFDRVVIASWSCTGNFRWRKILGSGSLCTAESLKTDTLGGVYVAGAMYSYPAVGGPGYFDTDSTMDYNGKTMFVVKYDTTGTLKWLKMPEPDTVSVGNPMAAAHDMDVAPNGDIYLYCQLKPGVYDNGAFTISAHKLHVLKYNANGVFQSTTSLNITTPGSNSFPNASNAYFKRDHKNGRYYVCGRYESAFGNMSIGNTVITKPAYLGSFDNNGNSLWAKQSNGNTLNGGMISSRVATDADENIYIGGITYSGDGWNGYVFTNDSFTTLVNSCPFVVKMDKNGNNIWATNAQSSGGNNYAGITLSNNTIACAGPYVKISWGGFTVAQPATGSPMTDNFLVRMNAATGTIIGMDSLKSTFGLDENANALASDKNGNFYVGGRFQYDLFVASNTLTSVGGDFDWFVAKYGSANCNCNIPVPNFSHTGSGNTFNFTYTGTTPYTSISWNFGDGSPESAQPNPSHIYTTTGTYNVCVTVTNACGSNTYCKSVSTSGVGIKEMPGFEEVNIYPNPAMQNITIENTASGIGIAVYNTTGQCVLQTLTSGNKTVIDVSNLSNGIYIIRLTGKDARQGMSKFIKQ
jgi:PKD repeat protein